MTSELEGTISKGPVSYELSVFTPLVLRETSSNAMGDTPDKVNQYFMENVQNQPSFDPMKESFIVHFLNTKRRIIGHQIVAIGILDSVNVHPREVFRTAIVASAHSIIISHNHPSGDTTPSDADIKITRDLIRAGVLLRIELVDHLITGNNGEKRSLREYGYFHN